MQIFRIAGINLWHNAIRHIVLALLIVLLTPILFGVSNLNAEAAAVPLELFLSLTGIVLLTPVFQPEQNTEIDDLVSSKYVNTITVYLIRMVYSVLLLVFLISGFLIFMGICDCEITGQLWFGTIADSIALGGLGMLAAAVVNHTAIAYMFPLIYYILNYGAGKKLGNFYLFSMGTGDYEPKLWLFFTGIILIAGSVLIKCLQKKRV